MGTWCTEGVKRTKLEHQRIESAKRRRITIAHQAERIEQLQAEKDRLKDIIRISRYCSRKELIQWLKENKVVSDRPFEKEKTIVLRMIVIQQALQETNTDGKEK